MQDFNNQNNQGIPPIPPTFQRAGVVYEKTNSVKGAFLTNTLLIILICVFGLSLISAAYIVFGPQQYYTEQEESEQGFKSFSKKENFGGPVSAVIKIRGTIQEGQNSSWSSSQNPSQIAAKIRDLAEDKNVHSLLLDINTPGGTVASVQDIYSALMYFKSKEKPVVAMFRDISASGGYYIAAAADKIVAQPGTITGSIGVIMQGANFTPLLEKIGVSFKPIKSAKHKDIGSPYREMTEEEEKLLQDMINDTYAQFFDVVKKSRPNIPEEKLRIYADGRVWTGNQAKELGLIDELGGITEAKKLLEQLTGKNNIRLAPANYSSLSELGSFFSSMQGKFNIKIEDAATPKVYYLWTY